MIMDDLMDSLFATFQASAQRAVAAAQPITVAPDRLKWSDTAWITARQR